MKLSKVMAGFTGGQADTLRKAMGKKIKELMDTMKEQFIEGCLKNTISQDIAEKVWHGWEEFAKYGFNKSHSACYAFIAYQTAYLKAHYPTEFMASLLTADQENAEKVALEIEECKQMGISVLPPSVNESFHDFTVIKSKHIRFGLTAIKNLGESGVNAILEARGKENIPFASLEDFLVRTEVSQINKKNLEALVFSGALDAFASRGDIASHIEECIAFAKEQSEKTISGQMGLFGDELNTLSFYRPNNFSFSEILQLEKEYLGLFVSSHPLSGLQEYAKERFFCLENIQADDEGSEKKVIGIIEGLRMMRTKSDDKMAFFVLQTPSGKIPVAVFPRVFAESSKTLFDDAFVIVTGKLEVRNSEYQIRAEKIFSKNLEAFRLEAEKSGKISHDISVNTHIPSVKESPKKPQIFSLPIPKTIQREVLESLKTLLLKNPGNDEVVLVFSSGEKMKLPQKVALSRVLKTHLLQMVKE
jgi:DNA polymerase-3 subunit alpha